jgi:hypothetical protein
MPKRNDRGTCGDCHHSHPCRAGQFGSYCEKDPPQAFYHPDQGVLFRQPNVNNQTSCSHWVKKE